MTDASTSGWTTLVAADALAAALDRHDLRIVDCRFSLAAGGGAADAGEAAYREAHIPGAVYAHLDRDLSGSHGPSLGRHPWPSADAFGATLARWGVTPSTQVVAYDDGDSAFASRLWWLLRTFGHARVAVLDGGWAAWRASALPVTARVDAPAPVAVSGAFDENRLVRDASALQAHLDAGGLLLDARAAARFRGEVEPIDPRAGHVPGAINRAYADNLHDGRFKSSAVLATEFDALLGTRHAPVDVVAMCGSGVTACHHLLAMAHVARDGGRLYAPSWSGWINDPTRPVAVGGA
ncbi:MULTISPECIES: sulfurtransferase [Luteimonas]|uniref:sulfurtransferase n=1 Tax=Luteimonas TaxID=83614 RepID=UPI000C7A0C23|nr:MULTISPECIES: sulfurtransferase [Luteimonas]